VLGVHLGQYLIEMRLAEHRRPLSRAQHDQGCATDEFFDERGCHAFGGRDDR
jgi:hypothetical protein